MTDHVTVDISMTLPHFLVLPEAERQFLLAAGAHFRSNLVVAERLPVGEVAKLPVAIREGGP